MDLLHQARRWFAREEKIHLDFSGVIRINSAGLALLIEWIKEARRGSRLLEISNPPGDLLAMARICDVEGLIRTVLHQHEDPGD